MTIRNTAVHLLAFGIIPLYTQGQFDASSYDIEAEVYHVSPDAESGGDGTKERPFVSLEEARDHVRKEMLETMTPPEGATIQLKAGVYYRDATFELDHKDTFPAYSQLVIQGSAEGETVIHMGKRIPLDQLKPVQDREILQRLRPEIRDKVKVIDVKTLGIRLQSPPPLYKGLDGGQPELFFNKRRLPISKYPNEGTMTMGELISPGNIYQGNFEGGIFKYKDGRHLNWMKAVESGLWMNGQWRIPWQSWSVKIKSIDHETGTVSHSIPIGVKGQKEITRFSGIGSKYTRPEGSGEEPYIAFNLMEEIDLPGEWSIDYETHRLYVWLPSEDGTLHISYNTDPIFELKGSSQVRIRNITFKGGRESGVEIYGGLDNVLEHCRFENLGGWGVIIRGGFRNGIRHSEFTALGKGGIELSGGDPVNLVRCENFASNNTLHDLSHLQKTWTGAIKLGMNVMHGGSMGIRQAVGIKITDNEIYNLPHIGILAGGNFNEIRRNIIYDIAKETHDVGYIYTRHDMTSRGNIISDNLFYGTKHAHGFHLDDGVSSFLIERNVIIGSENAVQIGGGHYHIVRHNIMIDCKTGYRLDNRGINRNYTLNNRKKVAELMIPERAPKAWYGQFPELRYLYTDKPEWPKGNSATGNHYVRCETGETYWDMNDNTPDFQKIMQSRNEMKNNKSHDPDVLSTDHSELVELFRDYLKTHGVMPAHLPPN
jgi:hypothetical protein